MNRTATPSPYLDLSTVISALRGSLGGWGVRGLVSQTLVMLLYRRLAVICGQMERLAQRFQAGRLFRSGPRLAAQPSTAAAEGERCRGDQERWPHQFGWLVRLAAYQAAGYGCQLQAILGTPEMMALLVAAPQAARILRPLCRMLAVETSLLRPRPAGDQAEVACATEGSEKVVRKRVRRVREPVDWGRIPLPRGVLAAARRQGVRNGK